MRQIFTNLADNNCFSDLLSNEFAIRGANFICELNVIHPFREGNGRTQNAFLIILADRAGHPLEFERLDPPRMMDAMIASFRGEERPLAELILDLMRVR